MEEFKIPAYFIIALIFYVIGHVVSYYKQRGATKILKQLKEYNNLIIKNSTGAIASSEGCMKYFHSGIQTNAKNIDKYFLKNFDEDITK